MPDVADQIKAWADASSEVAASRPVPVDASIDGGPRRGDHQLAGSGRGRRLALVGVIAVFVGALTAVAIVANTRTEQDSVRTEATAPGAGPVVYRELGGGVSTSVELGALHAATTPGELFGLWAALGLDDEPLPSVDFDREVAVAMTVLDRTCALTLEGFDRSGDTVTAQFEQPASGCERAELASTFVVALDRASVGAPDAADSFRLVLPRQFDDGFGENHLVVSDVRPAVHVYTSFDLQADTVAAGSTLDGTVQVWNNTSGSLDGGTCGPFFTSALQDDAGRYEGLQAACLQAFSIPPGLSSYPVTVRASYGGCSNSGPSDLPFPPCDGSGDIPSLPAGRYEVVVVAASDVVPDLLSLPEPITVTVT